MKHFKTTPTQHYRVGPSKPPSMAKKKGPTMLALNQDTFQNTDLELLTTGLLADAQVQCGDRTWKVHKNILCTRSEWFKKALLGPFEEGRTGQITLALFTEDEVDFLLHFLYTGSVNFPKAFPDLTMLVAIIKTWKMADFFCLEILQDLLVKALERKMEDIRKCLCSPLASEAKGSDVDQAIKDEVLPAIRALYQDDVGTKIRDTVLKCVLGLEIATIPCLESRKNFGKLFREIPQFAVDWATAFVSGLESNSLPDLTQGKSCAETRSAVRRGKAT